MRNMLNSGFGRPRGAWWRGRPPKGIAGAAFWLAVGFGLLWMVRQVPRADGALLGWMQLLVGITLVGLAFPIAWRLIRTRLLWSLRSKLILTYLLIGLAPVVLFVTLTGIAAYVAAGQFSIHLADSRMQRELGQMSVDNTSRVRGLARILRLRNEGALRPPPQGLRSRNAPPPGARRDVRPGQAAAPVTAPAAPQNAAEELAQATPAVESLPDALLARLHPRTANFLNGAPLTMLNGPGFPGGPPAATQTAAQTTLLGFPPWAADLHNKDFHGLVLDGEDLYLVAIDQRRIEGSGMLSSVTSLHVDSALTDVIAQGLGRVRLAGAREAAPSPTGRRQMLVQGLEQSPVYGGVEPFPVSFSDFRVHFVSTLNTIDWDTGDPDVVGTEIDVHSRPSLLYRQLFGSSLGGIVTNYYRDGLIALCIVFALIEALALWMAMRLSGAITASVHELYEATQRVDRGDFVHRISAFSGAQEDQLGELAVSFNRMTGSLERLLGEQKEKERLQSELTIAQEVQANLFPHRARDLPTLELHGICRPARTVSGDYYDFLVFHHQDKKDGGSHENGAGLGRESGVGIVLGDISGKGISAALLMATLHSAVRAYRFASEDLVYSESSFAGLTVSREALAGDSGKLFESPGRILSLLNRHLYRSTQPEKYATLFLAHYDAATAQLTYSNAGHLPPLVLSRDGKIRRLDRGGTVVGLMDGMRYEEGRIEMKSGDILVAYSDGVTEPENDFGDFGEARLMEVVTRYRDQPLHVISEQVMLALDAWIGAEEQPDDITLVLARQV